jgi:hypothetical protein
VAAGPRQHNDSWFRVPSTHDYILTCDNSGSLPDSLTLPCSNWRLALHSSTLLFASRRLGERDVQVRKRKYEYVCGLADSYHPTSDKKKTGLKDYHFCERFYLLKYAAV